VHLAAYTAVDRAETEESTCFAVNAAGTESMSRAAKESGAHLIAISTDYVFDGNKAAPTSKTTSPIPLTSTARRNVPVSCSARVTTPLYARRG